MTQSLPPKSLVLYADDDKDDVELLKDIMETYASIIELISFENGLQLLNYLEQTDTLHKPPCLVILDINMPVMDGKQTLKSIRNSKKWRDLPVVLFTTSTLPSEAAFAHSFNAGFIVKPLYVQQVHAIIHQLLDHCTDEVKERIKNYKG